MGFFLGYSPHLRPTTHYVGTPPCASEGKNVLAITDCGAGYASSWTARNSRAWSRSWAAMILKMPATVVAPTVG